MAYLIRKYKFDPALGLASTLGALVASRVRDLPLKGSVLIPIPSTRTRWAERGFNPAAELAAVIASELDASSNMSLLTRTGNAPPQTTHRTLRARRQNVRGAFRVVEAKVPANIILVDDVMTTGSTVEEATRTLLKAGASCVRLLICARA